MASPERIGAVQKVINKLEEMKGKGPKQGHVEGLRQTGGEDKATVVFVKGVEIVEVRERRGKDITRHPDEGLGRWNKLFRK